MFGAAGGARYGWSSFLLTLNFAGILFRLAWEDAIAIKRL